MSIAPILLPTRALLAAYRARGHTDCLFTDVPRAVTLGQYITAFYASPAFYPERFLLSLIGRPARYHDILRLAHGADDFAAWTVEGRTEDQLLLRDFMGRTRSWLMVEALAGGGTRLYFGSAVVRREGSAGAAMERGVFRGLLWFHRRYSRALLWRAAAKCPPRCD